MESSVQLGLRCDRKEQKFCCDLYPSSSNASRSFDFEGERLRRLEQEKNDEQKVKENALLNQKSRVVMDEIGERRWVPMYSRHLVGRIKETDRLEIVFSKDSNLSKMASLSLQEPEDSSATCDAQPPMYESSTKQHLEVLERRRKDAQIGKNEAWATLNALELYLTSGNCPARFCSVFEIHACDRNLRQTRRK